VQEGLMEAVGDLTGSIGELIADRTIGTGDAIVDGGGRRRRFTACDGAVVNPALVEMCR
jgi:hypothetical protein